MPIDKETINMKMNSFLNSISNIGIFNNKMSSWKCPVCYVLYLRIFVGLLGSYIFTLGESSMRHSCSELDNLP